MRQTAGKKGKRILLMTVAVTALAMSLIACGGKKTDTVQRAPKETDSGKEELAAAMKGEKLPDEMKGDNQAVIEIGTAEEFAAFRDRVNAGEQALDAVLTADIDLSSLCGESVGNWVPIASEDGHMGGSFNGVFDGAGHVIRGLYIAGEDAEYAGLFLKIGYTGIVKELGLEDVDLKSRNDAAALTLENEGIIENCYASGSVKGYTASGLIGNSVEESMVTGCYNLASVEGKSEAAGVVRGAYQAKVSGCYNQGAITIADGDNQSNAAGVLGSALGSIVTDCYNTGAVSGGAYCSGVSGNISEGTVLTGGYNKGAVTATGRATGVCDGTEASVLNRCYNEGTVQGNICAGVTSASGENGRKSVVANCFNKGNVSATGYSMGVAITLNSVMVNCYNLGAISSSNDSMSGAAGVGGAAIKGGDEIQMMYNCYGAGPLTEGAGGLIYWNDTQLESVFYQNDTAAGYFFNRKSDEQDATHSVSREDLTGGKVLEQLNAYVDSFAGLPEGCVETGDLSPDKWKAGADGYPVLEWAE